MQEEETIDGDYIKGFNEGYILTKHEPKIAESLAKINSASPRIVGMKEGREQFVQDRFQELRAAYSKSEPSRGIITIKTRDKDLEPEH